MQFIITIEKKEVSLSQPLSDKTATVRQVLLTELFHYYDYLRCYYLYTYYFYWVIPLIARNIIFNVRVAAVSTV